MSGEKWNPHDGPGTFGMGGRIRPTSQRELHDGPGTFGFEGRIRPTSQRELHDGPGTYGMDGRIKPTSQRELHDGPGTYGMDGRMKPTSQRELHDGPGTSGPPTEGDLRRLRARGAFEEERKAHDKLTSPFILGRLPALQSYEPGKVFELSEELKRDLARESFEEKARSKLKAFCHDSRQTYFDLDESVRRFYWDISGKRADFQKGKKDFKWNFFNLTEDLEGVNFAGVDLRYANLSKNNMRRADLTDTQLSGAELHFTNLRGANLKGVNLSSEENEIAHPKGSKVKVKPASLQGVYLEGANLEGACLLGVNLCLAGFTGAQLKDAEIGRKPGAESWQVTNLESSDLNYDQLKTMRLRPGIIFPERLDIRKVKDIIREKVNANFLYLYNELDLAELMFELNPSADELKMAKEWKEKALHNINVLNEISKF